MAAKFELYDPDRSAGQRFSHRQLEGLLGGAVERDVAGPAPPATPVARSR